MIVLDEWLLTPQRAAVHQPSRTAVVADLHLGYDRARRRGGDAVPGVPVAAQMAGVLAALRLHGLTRLAVAGDLLEDGRCRDVLDDFCAWLQGAGVELVGVAPGNHDGPALLGAADLPVFPDGFDLGGWRVLHGDGSLPAGRVVCGHVHPWARWRGGAGGPCYLVGAGRLVLPACSADAAGVNVIGARPWRDFRCCVIAGDQVLDFGPLAQLRASGHPGYKG
jgi:metallophosphoesterase superfamily enzyme